LKTSWRRKCWNRVTRTWLKTRRFLMSFLRVTTHSTPTSTRFRACQQLSSLNCLASTQMQTS
jgi:hypothetical protein